MACHMQTRSYLVDLHWVQSITTSFLQQFCSLNGMFSMPKSQSTPNPEDVMPTSPLPDLPPEIVRMVLQHLMHSSRHEFLYALQVSQSWATVGQPLVWKDVVLTPHNLRAFVQAVEVCPELAQYTQSLTVRNATARPWFDDDSWTLLQTLLAYMTNLRSFSFSLNEVWPVRIHYAQLGSILRALPRSLSSLELDLDNVSIHSIRSGEHACETIRNLLPQLQHLRLNRGVWCHYLFEGLNQTCANLESVTINDSRRSYGTSCVYHCATVWRSDLVGESIALAARKAVTAGLMPSLRNFDVIVRVSPSYKTLDLSQRQETTKHSAGRPFVTLQVKNVLQDRTTSFPMSSTPFDSCQNQMIRYFGGTDGTTVHERMGTYNEISAFIEGSNKSWIRTTKGARFPATFRNSSRARVGHYEWTAPSELKNLPSSYDMKKKLANSSLWYWEDQCGRTLLHPQIHEGLERGPAVTRELCTEENDPRLALAAPKLGKDIEW